MSVTNITHTNLAVQAFKTQFGRAPAQSLDARSPDEAWLRCWVADHVATLCREDPAYAHRYAIRTTWRALRTARLRLKAAQRTTGGASTSSPAATTVTSQ
jgi:hypothetical protein